MVRHAKCVCVPSAEVAVPQTSFVAILNRIGWFRPPWTPIPSGRSPWPMPVMASALRTGFAPSRSRSLREDYFTRVSVPDPCTFRISTVTVSATRSAARRKVTPLGPAAISPSGW